MGSGWIGSRRFDAVFFLGAPGLALLVGALLLAAPALVVPAWWLWLLLGDGPHLLATYTRSYLDREDRRRLGTFLWTSLAWLLPGLVAFLATEASGSEAPFELYLLFASLWSFHHAVRQHYGILSIYERHAGASARQRAIDARFLYAIFWGLFGLFLVAHPFGRRTLGLPEALPPLAAGLLVAAEGLALALGLAYAVYALRRIRRREAARPAALLLALAAMQAGSFFVIGRFEPVYPRPTDPEQFFLVVTIVGGVVHSLQYLGIVLAANRRRAEAAGAAGLSARLGRAPLLTYGLLVALSLAYLALVAARGISPGAALFAPGSAWARLSLAIYWGLFFHHYYLDQKIWRPHRDARLRSELGL